MSDQANAVRWRGEAGFYEIWFLVVFDPRAERAWWFRYTTFAPVAGPARATLWAAAFDARAHEPVVAGKSIVPIEDFEPGRPSPFGIRIGSGELTNDACSGRVEAGGHAIEWSLAFAGAASDARRQSSLLDYLPLPTHVAHVRSDLASTGWVAVDGTRYELQAAPGIQKHIWGTRRVEELYWLFCPRFTEDPAAALEATAARLTRRVPGGFPAPALTPIWLRTRAGECDWTGIPDLILNQVEQGEIGTLSFRRFSLTQGMTVRAWCDPRTLAGYVYRDPHGWDVHVAQSDVASCELQLYARSHPLAPWRSIERLTCTHAAAVEFHAPEPLEGVGYIPWDASVLGEGNPRRDLGGGTPRARRRPARPGGVTPSVP